jgi:hypothetical protein
MPKHNEKWRFAIGTTSRVPDSGGLHYLIADFDNPNVSIQLGKLGACNLIMQRTDHGWHLYTDVVLPFNLLVSALKELGADPAWIEIGKKRGYYFLADKSMIVFPWKVEHMVIHHAKEKA